MHGRVQTFVNHAWNSADMHEPCTCRIVHNYGGSTLYIARPGTGCFVLISICYVAIHWCYRSINHRKPLKQGYAGSSSAHARKA